MFVIFFATASKPVFKTLFQQPRKCGQERQPCFEKLLGAVDKHLAEACRYDEIATRNKDRLATKGRLAIVLVRISKIKSHECCSWLEEDYMGQEVFKL